MKTATKVKDLDGFTGSAALYKLSEPIASYGEPENGYEYVVVSAVDNAYATETYIFGSSESGRVSDWTELPGSVRGVYDHTVALNHAGYEVEE